jgi:S-adenosylmethionine hydrolase
MAMITLTTDFGVQDAYVGVMKGVILRIAPEARLVDLSHGIPPHDISRGAYVLCSALPYFPRETVHLAVIDPGVGTDRRAIAVRTPEATFVGPDNGLFTYVLSEVDGWEAVELTSADYRLEHISPVFHGRDIFAPAAAHLVVGVDLRRMGPPVTDPVLLPLPGLTVARGQVTGDVVHADRFGNLTTSVGRLTWDGDRLTLTPAFRRRSTPGARFDAGRATVEVAGQRLTGVHRTYGALQVGEPAAVVGSTGFLEISVRQGNAAQQLGVQIGDPVVVRFD